MTTEAPPRLLTADEFFELPDPPHGGKMELVCGRVVTHMPVGGPHGDLAGYIHLDIGSFVRHRQLGASGMEVGFRLRTTPDTVRAPDVYYVRKVRLPDGKHMPPAFFPGAPDLAVEVVSPDDTSTEVARKVGEYLEAGTTRVWVVDPELQTVVVHRSASLASTLHAGDVLSSDDAGFEVDGFVLALDDLFA